MPGGRDYGIDLESHQLTALSGLGTLCDLDLEFVRVDQVLCGDTEPSGGHLLDGGPEVPAIGLDLEPGRVLSSLTSVALGTDPVHGLGEALVGLLADGTERYGTGDEPPHDGFDGLDLVDRDGCALGHIQQIADEEVPIVLDLGEAMVLLRTVLADGRMEGLYGIGGPAVPLPVLPVCVDALICPEGVVIGGDGGLVDAEVFMGDVIQSDSADLGGCVTEVLRCHSAVDTDGLEEPGTAIGPDGRYSHLGHYLEETLVGGLQVVALGGVGIDVDPALGHEVLDDRQGHVRIDGVGTVSDEQCEVHGLPGFTRLHDQCCLDPLPAVDQMLMDRGQGQETGHGDLPLGNVPV